MPSAPDYKALYQQCAKQSGGKDHLVTVLQEQLMQLAGERQTLLAIITEQQQQVSLQAARKLEYAKRFKKYDWVEIDLLKNTMDFRPESYMPKSIDTSFDVVGHIGTEEDWHHRRNIVLKKVYSNLNKLIAESKDKTIATSLAVFKPTEILDFTIESVEREWDSEKLIALKAKAQQIQLFQVAENPFEVVNKLPFKFYFRFRDDEGTISKLMIEDWEIGALYWNSIANSATYIGEIT